MYCGKCGNELTEIDRFCPKCGSPISNDTNTSNNVTNHSTIEKQDNIKGRKHNSTVIVVASILVIILRSAYYDGNLQMYYDSWEECLKDAKKLKILRSNEEI